MNYDEFLEQDWPSCYFEKDKQCHLSTWQYFKDLGEIPEDIEPHSWCLHHIDPTMKYFDPSRYFEWRIDDVEPMPLSTHTALHGDFSKRNREYGFLDSLMLMKMNAHVKANRHH